MEILIRISIIQYDTTIIKENFTNEISFPMCIHFFILPVNKSDTPVFGLYFLKVIVCLT